MPRAMVLSAGFGTRLRPLTDERPKPLVPFGDRTLLEHALAGLGEQLLPAVVNAHHLADVFVELTRAYPSIAKVVVEPDLRGTAGGVAGARAWLGPAPVVVTNADVLAPIDALALLGETPADGLCLAVAPRPLGAGTVGLGEGGRVVRLRGERFGVETHGGDYLGTMALGEAVLASLPERGCLIGDVALPLARRGGPLRTLRVEGRWLAPGDGIADYLDQHGAWLAERLPVPGASFLGNGARVGSGVTLVSSVLGAGAEVAGSGRCERVVAWPGARFSAPLADAVVTTSGRIVHRPATPPIR
jgi:mannose-1-phosphate guanylyltransferase